MSLNISVDATSIHTLQLADTTNIPVCGCANLWFILDGIVFNHTFLVLTTCLDDIIIGANFFNQARLNLVIGPAQPPISYKQSVVLNSVRLEKEKVEEEVIVKKFLDAELPRFDTLKGTSNIAQHSITMKHDRPLKQRYSPNNPAVQNLINIEVDNLLEDQRIEPSKSPYSSPVVLVKKTNGEWRLCVDYRQINEDSVRDAYPLPKINYILEKLRNGKYFSTIDLRQGYWQIPMAEQSKHLTAFTVPGRGLFQFKVMPFGLHSAPATFQRALDQVIGPELEPFAFAYLDGVVVMGSTLEEQLRNLKIVFDRLIANNLRINPDKCAFVKERIKYLGHIVSAEGIHDPDKVSAILLIPEPKNLTEVRSFVNTASLYRRFLKNFSTLVGPLNKLLQKKIKWTWEEPQINSFNTIKTMLTQAPVLTCPDFERTFVLQTDASDIGLGAVLTQDFDDGEKVIVYISRTLCPAERNYTVTEKECLAIYWAVLKLKVYLECYHFIIVTEHQSLKWLNSIKSPSGRIARWALELMLFDYEVRYRKGKLNVVADELSRFPQPEAAIGTLQTFKAISESNDQWYQKKMKTVRENPEDDPTMQLMNTEIFVDISTTHRLSVEKTQLHGNQWFQNSNG